MNKVLGGSFEDCPIRLDSSRRCLYVKVGGKRCYLTRDNVVNYEVREKSNSILTGSTVTCVIEWNSGPKSVIIIDKVNYTFLVNGCELFESEIDPAGDKGRYAWLYRVVGLLIGGAIGAVIFAMCYLPSKGAVDPKPTSTRSNGTFSSWNRLEAKPNADVLVTVDLAEGNVASNFGYISGDFYNNSNRTFHHLEAIYTLYDTSGSRFGECTFSAFELNFSPGTTQGFTAICDAWREHGTYELKSVGFY